MNRNNFYLIFACTLLFFSPNAEAQLLDLKDIGESLGFPSEHLIFGNCLAAERELYLTQSFSELDEKKEPPFSPERILQAYKLSSDIEFAFHQIIITVVKKRTYQNEIFLKDVQELEKQKTDLIQKRVNSGMRHFGEFKISDEIGGFLMMSEIRVPAKGIQLDANIPEKITYVNKCPQSHPALVVLFEVPNSDVEIRIAKYSAFTHYHQLDKIKGGENYFKSFNEDADFAEVDITSIFKKLSIAVINSKAFSEYRDQLPKKQVSELQLSQQSANRESREIEIALLENPKSKSKNDSLFWIVAFVLFIVCLLSYIFLKKKHCGS